MTVAGEEEGKHGGGSRMRRGGAATPGASHPAWAQGGAVALEDTEGATGRHGAGEAAKELDGARRRGGSCVCTCMFA